MRNVILFMHVSLDGFVCGPNGEQDWMTLNLIDEYRIKLEPIVLGAGKPLFKTISDRIKLKLVKAKSFRSAVVALHYKVDRT